MEKSNSYYQRIFERFSNKAALSQSEEYRKTSSWASNLFFTTKEKEENKLINYDAKLVSNKRCAKALYKLHEDVIEYYKQTIGSVKPKTLRKYGRIITQFMIFYPTLDPKDLPGFLRHKFPLESLDDGLRFSRNSTLKQYITHIKRFIYIF